MIRVRRSEDRGQAHYGWLEARYSFSFGDYRDPAHTHFRVLRVINEDRIDPATGFGEHPHEDMEILTWVLEGELSHRDSTGKAGTLGPGELQHMSAGSGVVHSERNESPDTPIHLLQIWLFPRERGLNPDYSQKAFPLAERQGRLRLVASPDGADGSIAIQQDATLSVTNLEQGESVEKSLGPDRHAWVQVARGAVSVEAGGETIALAQGDGAAVSDEQLLSLRATENGSEVLVFDLP